MELEWSKKIFFPSLFQALGTTSKKKKNGLEKIYIYILDVCCFLLFLILVQLTECYISFMCTI